MRAPFLLLAILMLPMNHSANPGPSAGTSPKSQPVVVELFTSQGCSSCPPADALLTKLATDQRLNIIPLSFHVDYWNHLGWRDPYSSPLASTRQSQYAAQFHQASVYTPQVVVQGRSEFVGSNGAAIRSAVERSMREQPELTVAISSAVRTATGVETRYEFSVQRQLAADALAVVVLFQSGLDTAVQRGENGGRKLHNDFVVRDVRPAETIARAAASSVRGEAMIQADRQWSRLGVAVIVFDPKSRRILGAASRPVS
jgi:hypothetical protein